MVTLWVGGLEGGAETTVEVRAVVLATGASELVLPFPGWDLPGVTTTGAAQALLKSQGVTVGRRVLVGGSGPLLLPVAARLAEAGVHVVAVLEATPAPACPAAGRAAFRGRLPEAAGYAALLARLGVPVRTGYAVVACRGTGRVERAVIARLDQDWRPVPGSQREESVDAVHVSFGFSPALELPRALGCAEVPPASRPAAAVACDADQATSVPGVFAAGQVTGAAARRCPSWRGTWPARRPRATWAACTRTGTRSAPGRCGPAWTMPGGWRRRSTRPIRCRPAGWSGPTPAPSSAAARRPAGQKLTRRWPPARETVPAVQEATGCGTGYCQGRVCGPALQYAVSAASGRSLAP